MDQKDIYRKTEDYVTQLYRDAHIDLDYHSLEHTRFVVAKAYEISGHYQLSEEDSLALFLATWFHDIGYLSGAKEMHEERGVELMESFALENEVSPPIIEKAKNCILATRRSTEPQTLLEQIICDADTYNLGHSTFKETNKQVFAEINKTHPELDQKSFNEHTLALIKKHKYYTDYGRDKLEKNKRKNMKKLKKKLEATPEINKNTNGQVWLSGEGTEEAITEKAGTTKGMQTMLRLTSTNHIQLSEMADTKANILISVNAIIISVILSVLFRKLQTDPYLTIPTLIFLSFAVVTIVLSILATRPIVNTGRFEEEDVVNKKTNLLFFGNFHKMPLQQYESAMRTMMQDSDYLYTSIIQDIYTLGTVLGRKYRLVRLAYTIFMIGIVISVIAFAVATLVFAPAEAAATNISTGSPF